MVTRTASASSTLMGTLPALAVAALAGVPSIASADEPPRVVYLNFDGATLRLGSLDDARDNVTRIPELVGAYAPYGADPAVRAAVLQSVALDWFSYNIVFTDVRPASGHYMMSMVGPSDAYPPGTLGVAVLDCGDDVEHDVTFAFHGQGDGYSAPTTAATISQEIAHAFGLEHVDEPSDIMNAINSGGDPAFLDACLPTYDRDPSCAHQHAASCPAPAQQNSHRELLTLLGPRGDDAGGAAVEVTAPLDGEHFDVGHSLEIRVEAAEHFDPVEVELFVGGAPRGIDTEPPFGFTATDTTAGEYSLFVQARDDAGRLAVSPRVTVVVGAGTEARDDEPPGLPPGHGADRRGHPGDGACRIGDRPRTALWCVGLLLVLGVSRRRSATATAWRTCRRSCP